MTARHECEPLLAFRGTTGQIIPTPAFGVYFDAAKFLSPAHVDAVLVQAKRHGGEP